MRRIERIWNRAEQLVVGILGALALLAGLTQVLGRYIAPNYAITWAEEAIVYLLIWAVMIIASQLVRTDGHVRPDLVLRLLPPHWQRRVEIGNCMIALGFCGLLVWFGWDIVDMALMLDQRSPTDLQFPMWIYDAALPCGGGLMFLRYLQRLVRFVFHYDPETMVIGHSLAHEAPLDVGVR